MKSFVSILLLGLLVFNMMGFPVYDLLRSGTQTTEISSQENPDGVLKTPASLPDVTDRQNTKTSFHKVQRGADYHDITSEKLTVDTLYVQYRNNGNARDLFWNIISNFDDQFNSPNDAKNQRSFLLKSLVKEYMSTCRKLTFLIVEWLLPSSGRIAYIQPIAYSVHQGVVNPPPISS